MDNQEPGEQFRQTIDAETRRQADAAEAEALNWMSAWRTKAAAK